MDELKVEVGAKESVKEKLVRSRMTWAGHVEWMGDEKLSDSRCLGCGEKKEARKTEIAMGDCIKSDIERVAE